MDPEARHQACEAFHVKLSRTTGVNLTAAVCEALLDLELRFAANVEGMTAPPGHFYTCLGSAIVDQHIQLDIPEHLKVAWYCFREAAVVHKDPAGMGRLAYCYTTVGGSRRILRRLLFGFRRLRTWETPPPKLPWALSLCTATRALGSRRTRRAISHSFGRPSIRATVWRRCSLQSAT